MEQNEMKGRHAGLRKQGFGGAARRNPLTPLAGRGRERGPRPCSGAEHCVWKEQASHRGSPSNAPDGGLRGPSPPMRRPREGGCEEIGFVGFCARGPHPSRRPGLVPGPIPGALGRPRRSNPFSNGCGGRKRSRMGPGSSPGRRCLSGFVPFPDGRLTLRFLHTLEGGDPALTHDAAAAGEKEAGPPRLPREPRLGPASGAGAAVGGMQGNATIRRCVNPDNPRRRGKGGKSGRLHARRDNRICAMRMLNMTSHDMSCRSSRQNMTFHDAPLEWAPGLGQLG